MKSTYFNNRWYAKPEHLEANTHDIHWNVMGIGTRIIDNGSLKQALLEAVKELKTKPCCLPVLSSDSWGSMAVHPGLTFHTSYLIAYSIRSSRNQPHPPQMVSVSMETIRTNTFLP